MKLRRLRHLALVGCFVLPVPACTLFRSSAPLDSVLRTHGEAPAQLAQLDFGRDARFAHCLASACPTRTPKTLAAETPSRPAPNQPTARATSFAPIGSAVLPVPAATLPVPKVQTAHTVTVPFAFGSARLDRAAQVQLNNALADGGEALGLTITGRTDSTGPSAANEALALARAHAVRDYLRKSRPALAALTVEAQGACCFVASNDTPAGRAQNRRVEVVFHTSEGQRP